MTFSLSVVTSYSLYDMTCSNLFNFCSDLTDFCSDPDFHWGKFSGYYDFYQVTTTNVLIFQ